MPEAPRRRATTRGGRDGRPASTQPELGAPDGRPRGREAARSDHHRDPVPAERRPVRQIVASAREQLEEVIGRPVSAVLGFEPERTVAAHAGGRRARTDPRHDQYPRLLPRPARPRRRTTEYRRVRRYNRSQPDEDY